VAQDRVTEKRFAAKHGARTAPWAEVHSRADLDAAVAQVGTPAILKTTRFGYDGKGQARLGSARDADRAWTAIGEQPAILEGFVRFEREFSVILVRAADGSIAHWDAAENRHRDGILDTSTVPAHPDILAGVAEARATAERIAAALDYVGVLSVEFFATADGPVFNEMAPRVHNSGHWTIEGAETSQFENHIRAICGLPPGSTKLARSGAEMTNLIGEDALQWADILAEPGAHLHLYGKAVRAGRKMGHVTRLR
jgi:5-(carboxyamino)imidazole ribonucleotide synthase